MERCRNQGAGSFKNYLNFMNFTALQETPLYTGKISFLNAIGFLCFGFFSLNLDRCRQTAQILFE